jgi:hypothetical protein
MEKYDRRTSRKYYVSDTMFVAVTLRNWNEMKITLTLRMRMYQQIPPKYNKQFIKRRNCILYIHHINSIHAKNDTPTLELEALVFVCVINEYRPSISRKYSYIQLN